MVATTLLTYPLFVIWPKEESFRCSSSRARRRSLPLFKPPAQQWIRICEKNFLANQTCPDRHHTKQLPLASICRVDAPASSNHGNFLLPNKRYVFTVIVSNGKNFSESSTGRNYCWMTHAASFHSISIVKSSLHRWEDHCESYKTQESHCRSTFVKYYEP
jgi:hypothetical protein